MAFIKLKKIVKNYRTGNQITHALNNVDFEIEEGSFTIILGPSGSGKSTTLNILGGMDKVSSGEVLVDSIDISKLSEKQRVEYRRKDIGFVFQFYNLIPSLTAFENVQIVKRMGNNPFDVKEMLSSVGLEDRGGSFPKEMSGGELQRVSIARALCKNPKVLLCDEPTGALDTKTGRKVLKILQKMSSKYNKTVIIVTHNSSLASIANRIIHIKDGEVEKIEDNLSPISVDEVRW